MWRVRKGAMTVADSEEICGSGKGKLVSSSVTMTEYIPIFQEKTREGEALITYERQMGEESKRGSQKHENQGKGSEHIIAAEHREARDT